MLQSIRERLRFRGAPANQNPSRVLPIMLNHDYDEEQYQEESKRAKAEEAASAPHNRSVDDFSTADELRQALTSSEEKGNCGCKGDDAAWLFSKNERILQELLKTDGKVEAPLVEEVKCMGMDWILENYDTKTSEKQSLDHELRRLLVLKSFLILDTSEKESFDHITALAQKTFQTSYCMISLVDLGRQWFLSKQGLDATQTPRNISFCTHGIQSALDIFEVTDATQDERFKDNPLVNGPPYVQYYAGAPLFSPEGYKIGMFCICDMKPREAMTAEDRKTLKKFAAMAVRALVEHRRKMSVWFNNLVSTHFPDEVPGMTMEEDYGSESSSDESGDHVEEDDEEFSSFIESTKNLSLESVVGMLTKQAKEHQQQHKRPLDSKGLLTPDRKRHAKIHKEFRFAESAEVYLIEPLKEMSDELWYNPDEMYDIRAEKKEEANQYRNRRDYIRAIERISEIPQRNVKNHLRELISAHVFTARGLENSIVDFMRRNRKANRRAVVREQWHNGDNLRDTSLQRSQLATNFASNLAEVDHLGALIAEQRSAFHPPMAQVLVR